MTSKRACGSAIALSGIALGPRLRVGEDRVAVAEGAAPRVLPGEAHGRPLLEEHPEGEHLAARPVDLGPAARVVGPLLQERPELRVDLEARRERRDGLHDALELLADAPLGGVAGRRRGDERVGERPAGPRRRGGVVRLLELLLRLDPDVLDLGGREDAVADEGVAVEARDRGVVPDLLVEERLRVARLVPLVVAVAAVADHVDDDVVAERLPVLHREVDRLGAPPPGRRRSRGRSAPGPSSRRRCSTARSGRPSGSS